MISVSLCVYKVNLDLLKKSIESVLMQSYIDFELIIINDGIVNTTILEYLKEIKDNRIYILHQENMGISYSRNVFLKNAKGDIFTFIDADNTWRIDYLKNVHECYMKKDVYTAYAKLQYVSTGNILFHNFDYNMLKNNNFIDMNVFSFKKQVYEKMGGFDESLNRLVDWDLNLKYCGVYPPEQIDYIGCYYNDNKGDKDGITNKNSVHYNSYKIRKKHDIKPKTFINKKILYIVSQYVQHSETYVDWEMKYFIELGASIEVLADNRGCASPVCTDIKTHYDIDKAISSFQPDIIHIHWLHICEKYCKILREKGHSIPITTRVHGFEYTIDLIQKVNNNPNVKYIFTYQHLLNQCINNKIDTRKMIVSTIPINTDLHYPTLLEPNIDKIKVLRVAAGLTTKNIDMFIELANELDDFEFTLLLVRCTHVEHVCNDFINLNNRLGGKCKILINVAREEVGDYMRKSNIYLHTTSQISNYGQPISIAESLACGNYVLARKTQNIFYLSGVGDIYETKTEVIGLLMNTKSWDICKWNQIKMKSIDLAYTTFVPEVALKNMIDKL